MGSSLSTPSPPPQTPPPPPPPPPQPSIFTCEICIEPVPSIQKYTTQDHTHPFCTECVSKYITVKITDDSLSTIPCPAPECALTLDPLNHVTLLTPQTFVKWSDNLAQEALLRYPRSYCPNRDCLDVVVNECGGDVRKVKCPRCKVGFCFKCGVKWHAGYRCEESGGVRDENDVAFGVLAETRKWKRCPRCSHCVELIEGCSIVKCRCGANFCYKCGNKVKRHWCNCRRSMLGRVIYIACFLWGSFLLAAAFFAISRAPDKCGTSFCYKCGGKVKKHWCNCKRSVFGGFVFGVVTWLLFILVLIFFWLLAMSPLLLAALSSLTET